MLSPYTELWFVVRKIIFPEKDHIILKMQYIADIPRLTNFPLGKCTIESSKDEV